MLPIANSSILHLPAISMPRLSIRSMTWAENGGTKCSSILEAQVVVMPFVQILSLMAMGMPARSALEEPAADFLLDSLRLRQDRLGVKLQIGLDRGIQKLLLLYDMLCDLNGGNTSCFDLSADFNRRACIQIECLHKISFPFLAAVSSTFPFSVSVASFSPVSFSSPDPVTFPIRQSSAPGSSRPFAAAHWPAAGHGPSRDARCPPGSS